MGPSESMQHDDLVNQRGSEGSGVVAHLQAISSRLLCSTMIEEIPGGFPSHTEGSTLHPGTLVSIVTRVPASKSQNTAASQSLRCCTGDWYDNTLAI